MTRIESRVAFATGSLLVALLAGHPGTSAAQPAPSHWVLANEYPATSLPGEGDAFFAKAVADRVAGRLVVEPQLDARAGFKSREQLKAVPKASWPWPTTLPARLATKIRSS